MRIDALKHDQEILNYFEIGMVLACFSAIIGVASFSVFCLKRMPKLGNALVYIGRNTLIIMFTYTLCQSKQFIAMCLTK